MGRRLRRWGIGGRALFIRCREGEGYISGADFGILFTLHHYLHLVMKRLDQPTQPLPDQALSRAKL